MGAGFCSTGDTSFDIQGITLKNAVGEGGDQMKIYDINTKSWTILHYWDPIYASLEDEEGMGKPGWGDEDGTIQYKTVEPGQGFWILTVQADVVTVPGQVVEATANERTTLKDNQDMLASMFPCELDVQDITLKNSLGLGNDLIKIYDVNTKTWTMLHYCDPIYASLEDEDGMGKPGWGDEDGTIQYETINPGQGFWILTVQDDVMTVKSPL